MRKTSLFVIPILLGAYLGHAADSERRVVQVGTRPESVTKGFGGKYYVTVMGEQQPGDAVIKVMEGDTPRVFASGMDEPKGIAFTGKYLVTTDVKKVWKIDKDGNKSVLADQQDFPHPVSYLNDTAAAPGGKSVYVTDMGANTKMFGPNGLWPIDSAEAKQIPAIGRVYQINLDGKVTVAVGEGADMLNPNGVSSPKKGTLLVGEFFQGNLLEIKNGQTRILNTGFRGADAIERDKKGNLYVSSWTQGKVWKCDPDGKNPIVLIEGLQSAADFYLDEKAGYLIVPDMKAGTLTWVPLK